MFFLNPLTPLKIRTKETEKKKDKICYQRTDNKYIINCFKGSTYADTRLQSHTKYLKRHDALKYCNELFILKKSSKSTKKIMQTISRMIEMLAELDFYISLQAWAGSDSK